MSKFIPSSFRSGYRHSFAVGLSAIVFVLASLPWSTALAAGPVPSLTCGDHYLSRNSNEFQFDIDFDRSVSLEDDEDGFSPEDIEVSHPPGVFANEVMGFSFGPTLGYEFGVSVGIWNRDNSRATGDDLAVAVRVPAGVTVDRQTDETNTASNTLHRSRNRTVSVGDASALEGTDSNVEFEVTLGSRDDCETVTVDWETAPGTATAGVDYTAASGTLTFGPGETRKTVRIAVLDDTQVESDETLTLRLSNASGATIADDQATGTVTDGDGNSLRVSISAGSKSVTRRSITPVSNSVTEGGAAVFTLTRTGSLADALTVDVSVTETGAMLKGSPAATVTFDANSAIAELSVETEDDEVAESASIITAALLTGDHYATDTNRASATVTVQDDDAAPSITVTDRISAYENTTAVATLTATDDDTPVADLAWSIVGGADAAAFSLSEKGVLTFTTAKDYEAPDDADQDGDYEVTVRVTDGANPAVDATLTVQLTDVDEGAPRLTGARVDGDTLTLTFDKALDVSSVPASNSFSVTVQAVTRDYVRFSHLEVSTVSVSGSTVTLTLASAVDAGESVVVSYTTPTGTNANPLKDAAGNAVFGFSNQWVLNETPAQVNTLPTGKPAISGTASVGTTLTASVSGIVDTDGLLNATFAWQWVASDGTADTDIPGATGSTYTLTSAEAGKTIKVRVTFTDDGGTEEALVSEATAEVASVNAAPVGLPRIAGTPQIGGTLTASSASISDADGLTNASYAWQWIANDGTSDADISGATGATYTLTATEAGKTIKVRVTFTDDGGTEETLESAATAAVEAGLTASFEDVPASHDGSSAFRLRLAFSEEVFEGSEPFDKNQAIQDALVVNGGAVTGRARVNRNEFDQWWIRVAPSGNGAVTVSLPAQTDCAGAGAVCTPDGTALASRVSATVPGPVSQTREVSIAAANSSTTRNVTADSSQVTEGTAAEYTLTRTGSLADALTVNVSVTETGTMLSGTVPETVTFNADSPTAELTVETEDDEVAEPASVVTAALAAGSGYAMHSGAASASVTVEDDDAAPVVQTAAIVTAPENTTAVATLTATDDDTPVADLAWSIVGGADAALFTVSAGGDLAFASAKDFEAPDDADTDGDYEVTVRVTDGANAVDAALTVRLADVDDVSPVLTDANVNGDALTLTFGEPLDGGSVPAPSAFSATVDGAARGVSDVSMSGNSVTLTLASAVVSGETVTVGYTVPTGANGRPLRDAAENAVAGFSNRAVTNATPVSNAAPLGLPTVSGSPQVGETLTASASGIADTDGLTNATYAWQWIANDGTSDADISGATGATYTLTAAEVGKTIKVRVTFTDDGGTEETLESAATAAVEAGLTARFENVPAEHDGESWFEFEVSFSEAFKLSYRTLRDRAFRVTNGRVTRASRIDNKHHESNGLKPNRRWLVRVRPDSAAQDVTIVLPATTDCGASGAVCTPDGAALSGPVSATVPGPASQTREVSIAATDDTQTVTEGTAAEFTLTRTGPLADALTVNVSVTETGTMLSGTVPETVTFNANSPTAELRVETGDDEVAEPASVVTAALAAGSGYAMHSGAASASVTVEDDDAAPVVQTAAIVTAPENTTAVATLTATDDDTPVADLAWSIVGGADAAMFTVSAGGDLAFASAKDFEVPDDADTDGDYEVTVRVTDGANAVDAALTVRLADEDDVSPVLTGANVNGDTLTLTFGEPLDGGSEPGPNAFSATVDEAARGVSDVSLSGSSVTLTLVSAVVSGETVTVGYTVPTGANARPLRDAAENAVAGFSDEAVANDTPSEALVGIYSLSPDWSEAAGTNFRVRLVRYGDASEELTVNVSVTETGSMLVETPPSTFTFAADEDVFELEPVHSSLIEDDLVDEPDSEVTITILTGTGYRTSDTLWGGPSLTITVRDDDWSPEIMTESPVLVAENRTAIKKLTASRRVYVSLGSQVIWSLVGGADEDKVTLSANGDLAFKTAKDFEAPDDADTDGDYEIEVRVTDAAGNSTDASLTIRLTDVSATATGKPATSGTVPQVGNVLTATRGTIDDDDGVPATFTYQWVRVDGSSENDIAGATSGAYTLSAADVGKQVKVKMSFTDNDGNAEGPLAGDAWPSTGSVVAAKRACPSDADWCAEMTLGGYAHLDQFDGSDDYTGDFGFTSTERGSLSDNTVSHGDIEYKVEAIYRNVIVIRHPYLDYRSDKIGLEVSGGALPDGTAVFVAGATVSIGADSRDPSDAGRESWDVTRLSLPDWVTGQKVTVSFRFPGNTAPVGLPTISGTAQVAETLEASAEAIADADGLANAAFAWQWIANDGTSDADIAGATGAEYTLTSAEEGKTIKVRVTFTDDGGTEEVLVSEPTAAVNTVPTGLPVISGTAQVGETLTASSAGITDADGLTNATYAWQWMANDGTSDADIAGATGAEYALTSAEEGKTIKVRVTFTDDGGTEETLVSEATAAVTAALPSISVAAVSSPVTEGTAASFTLHRTGDTAPTLTVAVSVTVEGAVVSTTPASSVTFAAGSAEATLSVATVDDSVAEADARVSVAVKAGSGYLVGNGSGAARVDVYDNDEMVSALVKTLWTSTLEWQGDYGAGWVNANEEDFSSPGWSEDGDDYRIWYIAYGSSSGELWVRADPNMRAGGIPASGELTLQVGQATVESADTMAKFARGDIAIVRGIEPSWAVGEQVQVRLTRTTAGETTVTGPGVSVADAQVQEAEGAVLAFRVTLAEAQTSAVSVRYATSDGTATAGTDYEAVSGALRFAPGETAKTVSVSVLNDDHDEGRETLTLTLSSPFGAQITDGTATGTIVNTDPIPKAWIARFGRAVAEQVMEAVETRMRAPRVPGTELSLAGQRVGGSMAPDGIAPTDDVAQAGTGRNLAEWFGSGDDPERRHGLGSQTMTQRDLLLGSTFSFTGGTERTGTYALWGRGAVTRFDGREGSLSLDGEVSSGMLGADWSRDALMAGLVVSHSLGEGSYRGESGDGGITSSLTGLYPWGSYALSERLSVWGVAGYGEGTLTLTPEGQAQIRTDLDLLMAAAGLRGVLVQSPETGGFELAVKTDAMGVRTSTAKAQGLEAERAEVTGLRLGLEGSRPFRFEGGANLTPSVEIGARHDGGDAETGFGTDIGGGLAWSDPQRGLSAEIRGRGLLSHAADGFRERGFSGSLSWDPTPGTARGLSFSMSQTLGAQAAGGVDALLERGTLADLAANDNADEFERRRLELKLGYGFGAFGGRFTSIPEAGFGMSEGPRDYSLGWRLVRDRRRGDIGSLEFALEARRQESVNDNTPPEHSGGVRITTRW